MTVVEHAEGDRTAVNWRTLEWWGAGFILFMQSGAVLPLLMLGPDGALDDSERSKLRLLSLPVYLVATVAGAASAPASGCVAAQAFPCCC